MIPAPVPTVSLDKRLRMEYESYSSEVKHPEPAPKEAVDDALTFMPMRPAAHNLSR